ncbi:MAG TPA: hypothetical protein VGL58_00820 [Caulobacteraceae bacterium]|jgi:hypothetical protein
MKRVAIAAALTLAGLAACTQAPAPAANSAGTTPPAAPPSNAPAANTVAAPSPAPGASYVTELIPASTQWSAVMVRMNAATGKATLSNGGGSFIPVTDAAPPPPGAYKLTHYATFDSGATTREWEVYRVETGSGRVWELDYDGQTTASWSEIQGAP